MTSPVNSQPTNYRAESVLYAFSFLLLYIQLPQRDGLLLPHLGP